MAQLKWRIAGLRVAGRRQRRDDGDMEHLASLIVVSVAIAYVMGVVSRGSARRALLRRLDKLHASLLTESNEQRHAEIEREIEELEASVESWET